MSVDNLEPIAVAIGMIDEQIKKLKAEKDELEKEFRPAIAGRGNVQFGKYVFSVTTSSGRKTLDKAAMEADGIDRSQYEKVGKPFTTMKITRLSSDEVVD